MTANQTRSQTRSKFIDFQALKQEIKIEDAMPMLGLQVSKFSDQMRMPCPACKSAGDRALVITASKNVFYCFAAGEGGDVISLTAHVKGINMKEAAALLADHLAQDTAPPPSPEPVVTVPSNSSPKKEKAGLNPLKYLQAEHPAVQALGISPETCRHFGAGYAPRGIMRGRLAVPIRNLKCELVAYCGIALNGESPSLLFPTGFAADDFIFAAEKLVQGQVVLLANPSQVMKAAEVGVNNTIAFLTGTISPQQLEMLANLLKEKKCDSIERY